jgi:hypothetical protein
VRLEKAMKEITKEARELRQDQSEMRTYTQVLVGTGKVFENVKVSKNTGF